MLRKIGVILVVTFFVLLVSLNSCTPRIPPDPGPPPPVLYCYTQIADPQLTVCPSNSPTNFGILTSATLSINVRVLVYNTAHILIPWVYSGVTNPNNFTKSDLITNPNSPSSIYDCLPAIKVPGKVPFIIKVDIVGDCCKDCQTCSDPSGDYYGRPEWMGVSDDIKYNVYTKGNFMKEVILNYSSTCKPDKDCR